MPPAPNIFKEFQEKTDAKVYLFHCTFEGDYSSAMDKFKDAMQKLQYKVEDNGLQTIDCWGPSPSDCAYGHQIDVRFPKPKKLTQGLIKTIEKTLKPFKDDVYGRGCSIRYKRKGADTFFYGTTVKDVKIEIERLMK